MPEEQSIDLQDYVDALRRRRVPFLITVTMVFAIIAVVALRWPPTYRSTATILVEEQEIPTDLVRSATTSSAEQRIETIKQRVTTRKNLMKIIEKYDLYASARADEMSNRMAENMRKRIELETLNVEVMDPGSGRLGHATVAFTLSFEDKSPQVTQKVASELTSLFLHQNRESRKQKAAETLEFLSAEANKLRDEIADLETKLAVFKEQNANRLPELGELNLRLMDRTEQQLTDTENHKRSLEERKFYLEGQLAQINPLSPMPSDSGQPVLDTASRLKALRGEYLSASARYYPEHPDVVRLRREIQALQNQIGNVDVSLEPAKALVRLRAELAGTQEKYSENHPDVIRLHRSIASLETALNGTPSLAHKTGMTAVMPDNPAFITLQARLNAVNSKLESLRANSVLLRAKLADYEQRIAQSPRVDREYFSLRREHDDAVTRYREIKVKQMEAQVRQELEKQHGERFTLIDPAQFPQAPIKPNRLLVLSLGLLFALASGVGSVMITEARDSAVRSSEQRRLAEAKAVIAKLKIARLKQGGPTANRTQRRSA